MAPLMTSARLALIWPSPALDPDGLLRSFAALLIACVVAALPRRWRVLGRLPLSWHSCSSPSDRYPSHAKPQPRSTGLFPCPPSPTVPSSWPSSARLVPTADRRCRSRLGRQAATTSSLARRATGSLATSPWSAAAAIPTRALSIAGPMEYPSVASWRPSRRSCGSIR